MNLHIQEATIKEELDHMKTQKTACHIGAMEKNKISRVLSSDSFNTNVYKEIMWVIKNPTKIAIEDNKI